MTPEEQKAYKETYKKSIDALEDVHELVKEVRAELRMRNYVYFKKVAKGDMEEEEALEKIARMELILAKLEQEQRYIDGQMTLF